MAISSYYLAIIIGLAISLLAEIKLGISPGGLVHSQIIPEDL